MRLGGPQGHSGRGGEKFLAPTGNRTLETRSSSPKPSAINIFMSFPNYKIIASPTVTYLKCPGIPMLMKYKETIMGHTSLEILC
jgi:hypothetical protein